METNDLTNRILVCTHWSAISLLEIYPELDRPRYRKMKALPYLGRIKEEPSAYERASIKIQGNGIDRSRLKYG